MATCDKFRGLGHLHTSAQFQWDGRAIGTGAGGITIYYSVYYFKNINLLYYRELLWESTSESISELIPESILSQIRLIYAITYRYEMYDVHLPVLALRSFVLPIY